MNIYFGWKMWHGKNLWSRLTGGWYLSGSIRGICYQDLVKKNFKKIHSKNSILWRISTLRFEPQCDVLTLTKIDIKFILKLDFSAIWYPIWPNIFSLTHKPPKNLQISRPFPSSNQKKSSNKPTMLSPSIKFSSVSRISSRKTKRLLTAVTKIHKKINKENTLWIPN